MRMVTSQTPHSIQSLHRTKVAAVVACVFYLPAMAFTPDFGSSLGMTAEALFCTWGVMLVAAFISFAGYVRCRQRGQQISAVYVICRALLLIAFLVASNLRSIARAFAS